MKRKEEELLLTSDQSSLPGVGRIFSFPILHNNEDSALLVMEDFTLLFLVLGQKIVINSGCFLLGQQDIKVFSSFSRLWMMSHGLA